MEIYRFFIDRKITTWVREWHQCEAESLEEAKKEMISSFHNNMCVDTFDEQETLDDTEEYLEPGNNGGEPTAELYCPDGNDYEVLATNIN
jgi:hypothetical protein